MAKTETIVLRVSATQKGYYRRAAEVAGVSMSMWITSLCDSQFLIGSPSSQRSGVPSVKDENKDRIIKNTHVAQTFEQAQNDRAPISLNTAPVTIRECGVCGKDYDGDQYDSCPHPHEQNGKRTVIIRT